MGRPWLAYWMFPIPNQFGSLWVNFNSPLLWDVFAISTYLTVSLVFWWTGLLPDFAMIRDRAVDPFRKKIYSLISFGWSGRAKDWQRFGHRWRFPDRKANGIVKRSKLSPEVRKFGVAALHHSRCKLERAHTVTRQMRQTA